MKQRALCYIHFSNPKNPPLPNGPTAGILGPYLIFFQCLEDHDCPIGRYCNSKSGILYCEQCVDCSMLNREPSRILCAHSRAECGNCLPGYIDEVVICHTEVQIMTCTSSNFPLAPVDHSTSRNRGLTIIWLFVLFCTLSLTYQCTLSRSIKYMYTQLPLIRDSVNLRLVCPKICPKI